MSSPFFFCKSLMYENLVSAPAMEEGGYWGWQIGVRHAQAFLATGPLKVDDPFTLVELVTPRP